MSLNPGATELDKDFKTTKSATKDPNSLAKAIYDDLAPTSDNKDLGRIKDKLDLYTPIPAFDDKAAESQIHANRAKFCKAIAEAISEVISKEVCKHIKDNLEVKGIKVGSSDFIQAVAGGSGSPAVGTPGKELTQNNDGTGHVK
jgi:hypothetical protein